MGSATPKPEKGTSQLAHRSRTASAAKLEKEAKRASKVRDKQLCRFPHCEFRTQNLTMHSAHLTHKGMGGDEKSIRTQLDSLITLCSKHHGRFDAGQFDIIPLTPEGTNGPCGFRPRISGDRWGVQVNEVKRGVVAK